MDGPRWSQADGSTEVIGVFSHGGVRISAYAGAYEEIFQRGIRFSAVIGTSGGAIVAAFIAAGMAPAQIIDLLTSADDLYETVAADPRPLLSARRKLLPAVMLAVLDRFLGRRLALTTYPDIAGILPKDPITRLIRHLGLFGWQGLDVWMRTVLRRHFEMMRSTHRASADVTFADLPLPLTVVATDLATGGSKIWSRRETPDADVARAVTASCLIPIVFQPLVEDGHVYVDGGILSYSTLFLLPRAGGGAFGNPAILRFVLETRLGPWGVTDRTGPHGLLGRVIATVVAWERGMQEVLGTPIPTIAIPADGISPLNLRIDRRTRIALCDAGRVAARKFCEKHQWPA